MTRSKWIKSTSATLFVAVALMLAGCGGGGGGGVTPAKKSNLNLTIALPRVASSVTISSAIIEVLSYSSSGVATQVAYDSPSLTYNTTTYRYEGTYFINDIPVGSNYVVKMTLVTSYNYEGSTVRVAGQTGNTYTLYAGAIIPSIEDGKTADITVDAGSTVAAVSAIKYAVDEGVALSNTTVISSSVLSAIASAVETIVGSNSSFPYLFITAEVDPFTAAGITALAESIDSVLAEAGLGDDTAPTVSSFLPAANATGVAYNGTSFSVIFSESMDSTVNLNTQATLTASGFSITIVKSGTGGSLTIDSTNALSYGTFSWTTSSNTSDTLTFTLKSNTLLESASLSTLEAGTTYMISSFTVPGNLKDMAGNALSTTGIPTTGSFTTIESAPYVTAFAPANGAVDVAYDGTVFSVTFNESMDATVDLNNSSTLSASGFSFVISDAATGSVTINASNALSYGTFSWTTSSSSNDTLTFTQKTISELTSLELVTLEPSSTYTISSFVLPSNLTDVEGYAVDTSAGLSVSGSFTTAPSPDPYVTGFYPADTAIDVPYEGTMFALMFNESMDATVDLNNPSTLSASGFSVTFTYSSGTVTVDNSNAANYGTFAWTTDTNTNDKLTFTLNSSSVLASNLLDPIQPSTTYTVSTLAVPSNLLDADGYTIDTGAGVTIVGSSFTTAVYVDVTAPTVLSMVPDMNVVTSISYDAPTVSIVFSEPIDPESLSLSPFSIVFTATSPAQTITINESNYSTYGYFQWSDTSAFYDTLNFTMYTYSQLTSSSVNTLQPSTTYSYVVTPPALTDMTGNALDGTGIPLTGSFTTTSLAL